MTSYPVFEETELLLVLRLISLADFLLGFFGCLLSLQGNCFFLGLLGHVIEVERTLAVVVVVVLPTGVLPQCEFRADAERTGIFAQVISVDREFAAHLATETGLDGCVELEGNLFKRCE